MINQKRKKKEMSDGSGPSGIRAGWVLETKSRLGAE